MVQVKQLIANDIELLAKFESKLLASYIEDNNLARWCPSVPHCGNAVRVESEPHCEPVCSCGLKFCFNCCEAPHSPCTCDMYVLLKYVVLITMQGIQSLIGRFALYLLV